MPPLLLIYYIAISFWFLIEVWIELREFGKAITAKDSNSRIVIALCIILAVFLSTKAIHVFPISLWGTPEIHWLVGAIIIVCGASFRLWSVLTLGQFFRTTVMVQSKHKVISHGPYKYIRHPSYTGALVATIGVGVGTGHLVSLAVLFLFIFAGLYYRITVEEKVLRRELGSEYQHYMRHTKRLLPFIF